MVELGLLQELITATETAEITLYKGYRVVEDKSTGTRYNLDKMKERADVLFDKFMKQYAI